MSDYPPHHQIILRNVFDATLDANAKIFGIDKCESPIERQLFRCFVVLWMNNRTWRFEGFTPRVPIETEYSATITPQAKVGSYRIDFAVSVALPGGDERLIAIECDGHDFHAKTKEQVVRDKKRDRDLAALGYTVLRFTGSEIYADPYARAFEVEKIIRGWAE